MLVASFAMSNGDCLEGRHSVKEPLILGQLWAISTLQHINAGMVMMMSTTTTMTVAMMVTTLVLENCAKCFSKIFEANFYGNGSWTKSSLCSLMLSPQRGDRKLNMGYWVSGDPVELSFPPSCKWVLFLRKKIIGDLSKRILCPVKRFQKFSMKKKADKWEGHKTIANWKILKYFC